MIKRLSQFIKNENISVRAFEGKIKASDGMIRRAITNNTDIQAKWLVAIAENYPELNIYWLLTGKGEMLRQPPPFSSPTAAEDAATISSLWQLIEAKEQLIEVQAKQIAALKDTLKLAEKQLQGFYAPAMH